jgi:erythrocyte band 7 integral membrane protein
MRVTTCMVQVIAAEGEQKASRALKDASDIINESSSALQLRYLQTLSTISAEKNSTIIFPLPIELLQNFVRPNNNRGDMSGKYHNSGSYRKEDCASA